MIEANVARNVRAWNRRAARKARVRAEALRIKLSNPLAAAHPLFTAATVELARLNRTAHRHTQQAG